MEAKRRLTFHGLHGVISQKLELFIHRIWNKEEPRLECNRYVYILIYKTQKGEMRYIYTIHSQGKTAERITTSKDNETHKEETSGTKNVLQNWTSG
jgi:hypothetical protein